MKITNKKSVSNIESGIINPTTLIYIKGGGSDLDPNGVKDGIEAEGIGE